MLGNRKKTPRNPQDTFNWEAQPIYKTSNEESEGSMVGVTI